MSSPEVQRGDALVMFGLTGDLGENSLFPALAELATEGLLNGPVLGVGRSDYSDRELWDMFIDAAGEAAANLRDDLDLRYLKGDSTEIDTLNRIAAALDGAQRPVVYAALPPDLFATLAEQIDRSRLPEATRLIVEKPFGHDAGSALELYELITALMPAERLFLVDHFLAKASVENLLAFRAANPLFEAALRAEGVSRIEFTMAEAFGVEGRGSFYDGTGAIKDVVQNHILQTIAVLLMDIPARGSVGDTDADDFDRSRAALLGSIRPIDPDRSVVGQYEGYLEVEDVKADSHTETFFACALEFDCPRWHGVEFVLRTGKKMAETYTEAVVVFGDGDQQTPPNRLRFLLKPTQCITLEVGVMQTDSVDDAPGHRIVPTSLQVAAPAGHGPLGDYATMLDSGLAGDQRHFARIDDTRAAWRVVEPLLSIDRQPEIYEPGSMGPSAANEIVSTGCWVGPTNGPSSHRAGT